jgi:hypothetical protein
LGEEDNLEAELAEYRHEELYWQGRGCAKWILEGDSNTSYFYSIANGRRKKCRIVFGD